MTGKGLELRILLVDDDQDSVRALSRLLERQGYGVRSAASAAEALALVGENCCDLLISDLGLPDRDGLDLMRELAAQYRLPGIALTGHAGEEIAAQARAAGFTRHLTKPVKFDDLLTAIREVSEQTRDQSARHPR